MPSRSETASPGGGFDRRELAEAFKNYLLIESRAVESLAEKLAVENVLDFLGILQKRQGKIVAVAVGKSAFVARKFVATLNSVNVPAVFLHPADALHGDVGVVERGDVAVLVSNSGETPELLALLPILQRKKAVVAAILGQADSSLGKASGAVLEARAEEEACPLNLLPTASTAAAAAVCDALCISLSRLNEIGRLDFAANHPAGALGKRLNIRLGELIYPLSEQLKIPAHLPWRDTIRQINRGKAGVLGVVDPNDRLLGIITDGDVRRNVCKNDPETLRRLTAENVMNDRPVTMLAEEFAYDALMLMENRASQISSVAVVNAESEFLGIVRLHDILKTGLRV